MKKPVKFFSYISRVIQAPKFVIIKKQTEDTSPVNKIPENFNCLTANPRKTATVKDM